MVGVFVVARGGGLPHTQQIPCCINPPKFDSNRVCSILCTDTVPCHGQLK